MKCPACSAPVESPSDDANVIMMMMQGHYNVCKSMPDKQTGHPTVGQQKPKLVNERALDKMEGKEKPQ